MGESVGVCYCEEMEGFNANIYAMKKTFAKGMLDIALLTANASQLKYVLEEGAKDQFYTALIVLIVTSIVLQVLAGIVFGVLAVLNINEAKHHKNATILNNVAVAVVIIITVLNVIINVINGVPQSEENYNNNNNNTNVIINV